MNSQISKEEIQQLKLQLFTELKEAACEFWVAWNYEIEKGRKSGEIWLDEEYEDDWRSGVICFTAEQTAALPPDYDCLDYFAALL